MGAFLAWRMGTRAGEIPVKLQVTRIGRRPECDVSLDSPELADHALSVWWEDGKYVLNNVSDRPCRLDGAALEPQESLEWRPESTLTLSEDISVTLRVRGNPAPTSLSGETVDPVGISEQEAEDENVEDAARQARADEDELPAWLKSFRYEYVVILACCLLLPVLLSSEPSADAKNERRRVMALEKTVIQKLTEENSDPRMIEVRSLMARAASDLARGDYEAAAHDYGLVKNLVLRLQLDGGHDAKFLQDLGDIVKLHLDDLQ